MSHIVYDYRDKMDNCKSNIGVIQCLNELIEDIVDLQNRVASGELDG